MSAIFNNQNFVCIWDGLVTYIKQSSIPIFYFIYHVKPTKENAIV